jgi:protein-L-isoaspartate O-methyltransferase
MTDSQPPTADPTTAAVGRFLDNVDASLADAGFIRLLLSHPTSAAHELSRIEGRLIQLRGVPTLSLTLREARRDTTRNLSLAEVRGWLAGELGARFTAGLLETVRKDWQLSMPADNPARLVAHRPRSAAVPERSHDRTRHGPFDASAQDWLGALGLTDSQGRPLPKRADKYRQILRYAEILGHLFADLNLSPGAPLRLVDMGCGRGYLTFAAWQLLNRQLALPCEVVGVELRPELVTEAQAVVDRLGLGSLSFKAGSIADDASGPLDVLIALHACNTATDHALQRGVQRGARLILVAPCCHQELRPRLVPPELFAPLLEHGLFAERLSEWLTDGLRTLALEAAGYRTKVIEFVGSEHTPKNLLLAGLRSGEDASSTRRSQARGQFEALKAYFGIGPLAVESLLEP